MLKIYDTKLREKVPFESLEHGKIGMYVCGPTVYNYIHIGNARTFVSFDVIRRYLSWRGFDVKFVSNITDVDDKIIKKANEEGRSAAEVAAEYSQAFLDDMHAMNVQDPDVRPRATEEIPEMVQLIQELIDGGHAYEVEGDVYFSVRSYADYGVLSGRNIDEMEGGHRELRADGQGLEDRKRDHLDFALWKAAKPGEPSWESPWGQGRPGWHIECSAMSNRYLGKTIDIHCGGEDLQFPHHENEIAQSEAANGCTFVHYWLHNGFLNINNQKMSKSLGNFFTVREAAEAYGYEAVRFFMLSAQYRSPLNYSRDSLIMAQNALERLYTAESNLEFLTKNGADGDMTAEEKAFTETFDSYRQKFDDAMDDDLNTADAISVIFELVRAINIAVEKNPTKALAAACLDMLHEFTDVLGLLYNKKEEDDSLDSKVEAMIEARQAARKAKNFAEADRIRDELKAMGITLMDTPQGVKWSKD